MNDESKSALKVVIVEDNVGLAEIYKTRLELVGYTCTVAYDGEQALQIIEAQQPQLVLLDMMVPKIAGDQILAQVRATEWGKNIKVLVISNLNEANAPAGLRQLGIEGYVVKANLSNDDLDKMVDKILVPNSQTESFDLDSGTSESAPNSVPEPEYADEHASDKQKQLSSPAPVTTCLTFAHDGTEALDFYQEVFGGFEVHSMMKNPESGTLLRASFSINGHKFMAMEAGDSFTFSAGMSLFVECQDQTEVDYYWNALTAHGGAPGRCGWLTDKFGVWWQIVPTALGQLMQTSDAQKQQRVMAAMLNMNKIVVADLESA